MRMIDQREVKLTDEGLAFEEGVGVEREKDLDQGIAWLYSYIYYLNKKNSEIFSIKILNFFTIWFI